MPRICCIVFIFASPLGSIWLNQACLLQTQHDRRPCPSLALAMQLRAPLQWTQMSPVPRQAPAGSLAPPCNCKSPLPCRQAAAGKTMLGRHPMTATGHCRRRNSCLHAMQLPCHRAALEPSHALLCRGTRSVGQTRSGSLGGSFGGIAGTPHRSRARRADLGKWATPDRNRSRQPGFSQAEPSQLSVRVSWELGTAPGAAFPESLMLQRHAQGLLVRYQPRNRACRHEIAQEICKQQRLEAQAQTAAAQAKYLCMPATSFA